jgi:hypothetical protein
MPPRLLKKGEELHCMSTLFAFFHHLAAFTVVSALAIEFIRSARSYRLPRRGDW